MSISDNLTSDLGRWHAVQENGSFEEVMVALDELVEVLEAGQLSLDDSVSCYELGVRLAERCEQLLSQAELRVSRLDSVIEHMEDIAEETDDDDSDEETPWD